MLDRMTRAIASYDFGESGVLRQQLRLLATRRPVAWLSARLLPGIDSHVHRLTRGRVTLSAWITGLPVVAMQTTGARSGELRLARVLGIPSADGFLVVAANFGQAGNPAWYHNLRAHPRAFVHADRGTGEYEARELCGEEREHAFQLAISLNPGWRRFKERAGPRTIPVVRLTKIARPHP